MPPERQLDFRDRPRREPPMPSLAINGVEIDAQVRTYLNTDG
jgi:hypothetical protein